MGAALLVLGTAVPGVWLAGSWDQTTMVGSPSVVETVATATEIPSATETPSATLSYDDSPVATPTPATLTVSLADLGVTGTVAVAVYDLTTGTQLTAGSGKFETASVVKVDILVALLLKQNGSLTTSQRALAREMITESDNDAATALFQAVGSASGLNALNARLGLVETTAGTNGNWGLTTTTAADQLRLLRLIYQPSALLSAASQAYVTSLMTDVDDDQDWGVSAADEDLTGYAIKDGWLQRTTTGLWDVTSIGSVQSAGVDLLVVVLVNKAKTMSAGITTIESAARTAVQLVLAA